ncbi:MAG: C1 family peptidase [Opitutales bacterium]
MRTVHPHRLRPLVRAALAFVCLWTASVVGGERMQIGGRVYEDAEILRVTPESVTLRHAGGLTQLMLRELPREWQERLEYDPDAATNFRNGLDEALAQRLSGSPSGNGSPPSRTAVPDSEGGAGRILSSIGTEPKLYAEVDFRPVYQELDLSARDQGPRPSCSVFAMVSALEFQNALAKGRAEKLSEEYLVWATARSLGISQEYAAQNSANAPPIESGFSLLEVVQALRAYGIARQDQMSNTFARTFVEIEPPTTNVIESARSRQRIAAFTLPGREGKARVDSVLHALNHATPVVVGIAFPHPNALRGVHVLGGQEPFENYAHAVTLVGYRCETGRKEDVRFIFRNSWGKQWGVGGYGFVTYEYLTEHLITAVLLEVGET